MDIKESSPLKDIVKLGDFGVLLGNPNNSARRAIVFQEFRGVKLVTKLGTSVEAKNAVTLETQNLESLPEDLQGVPNLVEVNNEENWASYTTTWVDGSSPKQSDVPAILDFLNSWRIGAEAQSLNSLPVWNDLVSEVTCEDEIEFLKVAGECVVSESIVHGDFTPWNLKIDTKGNINVLDWECYRRGGAAGWDWAHYFVQSALLVDKGDAEEVLKRAYEWGNSVQGREYLKRTGWGRNVNAWIGTYLLYKDHVLKFDRKDLIKRWKKMK